MKRSGVAMKSADFLYERPANLTDALGLMAQTDKDPVALAGGQSLMPMMNFRMATPGLLVDLNGLDELKSIAIDDSHLRIGAMVRYAELERHPDVARACPLIGMALPQIAHPAIRNRGTLGGSLSLADPAAEMPAVMMVSNATMQIRNSETSRTVPAEDFVTGMYETALEDGDLLTTISIPIPDPATHFGFHEIARRHGDYAMAGAAVAHMPGTARIALFGVSDKAVRAHAAEDILGQDPMAIDAAVTALDDIDFAGDLNAHAVPPALAVGLLHHLHLPSAAVIE